jgi:hypothetical protein
VSTENGEAAASVTESLEGYWLRKHIPGKLMLGDKL